MARENKEFAITGINHLALVCSDMERTVDFYTKVLGFPLIKTLELPFNMGQHFFFDIGNGDSALTDDEARLLAQRIDQMPAGGGIVGAIVLIFLVLLVTDVLGLTDVFPFTKKGSARN